MNPYEMPFNVDTGDQVYDYYPQMRNDPSIAFEPWASAKQLDLVYNDITTSSAGTPMLTVRDSQGRLFFLQADNIRTFIERSNLGRISVMAMPRIHSQNSKIGTCKYTLKIVGTC